jgi:hypothetical protein
VFLFENLLRLTMSVTPVGVGIAQPVEQRAASWAAEESGFDSRGGGGHEFTSPLRPDRLWGPFTFYAIGLFPPDKVASV